MRDASESHGPCHKGYWKGVCQHDPGDLQPTFQNTVMRRMAGECPQFPVQVHPADAHDGCGNVSGEIRIGILLHQDMIEAVEELAVARRIWGGRSPAK
jgi:hypothetical protein